MKQQVEAWSADKAAEALRCQKLLVEEEDAAQHRLMFNVIGGLYNYLISLVHKAAKPILFICLLL